MQPLSHDFLTVPLEIVTALHILTLTLHLLAMNFLLTGLVAVLWGGYQDRWKHPVVQRLVGWFPSLMAATVSLGVAPLLFAQLVYGRFLYSAAIVSGWLWLAVVPLVIVAYFACYSAAFAAEPGPHQGRRLGLAFVCMILVAGIYSSTFALAERPELQKQLYQISQAGTQLHPGLLEWGLRWLHSLLGALTVGGFLIAWIGQDDEEAEQVGKRLFLSGLVLASLVGLAYLGSLGPDIRPFMRSPGVKFMGAAILASVGAAVLFLKGSRGPAGLLLFGSLLGMVATRHHLRLIRLADHFDPATLPIQTNWGPFGVFLVSFVLMLGVLYWMFWLYQRKAES